MGSFQKILAKGMHAFVSAHDDDDGDEDDDGGDDEEGKDG